MRGALPDETGVRLDPCHETPHSPTDLGVFLPTLSEEEQLPRKEVIQPHLPVQLPCYDFVPVTDPTLGTYLPTRGLAQRLQVLPASMT